MSTNDSDELRRIPDWEWLKEILDRYTFTDKVTGREAKRDCTGVEAQIYREIQNRYRPRKKYNYIQIKTRKRTTKQYEQAEKLFSKQIEVMDKMGYGLMLDGFTFYKYGHELEPYDFETNFNMHQAYVIEEFINQTCEQRVREARVDELKQIEAKANELGMWSNRKEIIADRLAQLTKKGDNK